MGLNRDQFTFDNSGSPAGFGNFGPFSLPTTLKMLDVVVNYTALNQFQSIDKTTSVENPTIIGVQVVFSGDPPFNLPIDAGVTNFLDTKPLQDDTFTYLISPDTATIATGGLSYRQLRWSGQKFFGAALDLYVTWSYTYVALNQEYAGHMLVTYTT